ncbi:MAG: hypothetical protein RLZZ511_687 [Cyanobacteriota bacterium]|jgi:ubiquinone/menaquinone biosynthesis C-methylase UbiE
MSSLIENKLEQLRQHFNAAPYLNFPIEKVPEHPKELCPYDITTAFYRRDRRVIDTQDRIILDAGCGTGYKSLALAKANPGAKIVGVDLSDTSVEMSRQRLNYQQIENCEFHAMPLERIAELGIKFDYINCDEVLYLVPDPIAGLRAMQSVLKPDGIIRVNYHSEYGRRLFRSAQNLFAKLGCMQGTPNTDEIALVRQTMEAMHHDVTLKLIWSRSCLEDDETILANFLLQNDKSWSVEEFLASLHSANLSFYSMVEWWEWELLGLFDIDELPFEAIMQIAELSQEDHLILCESTHWQRRLLDLWCGHPQDHVSSSPAEDWSKSVLFSSMIHFHPRLRCDPIFQDDLRDCAVTGKMLDLSFYLRPNQIKPEAVLIDSMTASIFLPLLERAHQVQDLVHRWTHLRPINPVTMEPSTPEDAFEALQQIVMHLENLGYIMLEDTLSTNPKTFLG